MSVLNETDVASLLEEAIREIQEMSGEPPEEIGPETVPITGLSGFDSLRGVEATCLLEEKLGVKLQTGSADVNPFISKDGRRALRLREIVDRLIELAE